MKTTKEKIHQITEQMFEESKQYRPKENSTDVVDYYQEMRSKASKSLSKPLLNGSTQKILFEVKQAVERLSEPYRRARDDSDRSKAVGDNERASIMQQQYMDEAFLPTVESLVMMNSPEEVLNSSKALAELDKYALVGAGRANGYTASFIRTLHARDFGNVLPTSDINVVDGVRRIRSMVAENNIRAAIHTAKKLKDFVDKGEYTASPEDYELLQKVALR